MHWHHNSMKSKLLLAIANCISNVKTMIAFGDIFLREFRNFICIRWLFPYIRPFKCHWECISKSKIKLFCWLQKWEIVCSNTHKHIGSATKSKNICTLQTNRICGKFKHLNIHDLEICYCFFNIRLGMKI